MAALYFIGTEHADIDGAARLEKLLEHLAPTAIAVEIDEQRAQLALENFAKLEIIRSDLSRKERFLAAAQGKGFNRKTVEEFYFNGVGLNYEFLVPKLYWEPKEVPVVSVDTTRTVEGVVEDLISSLPFGEQERQKIAASVYRDYLKLPPSDLRQVVNEHYQLRELGDYRNFVVKELEREFGAPLQQETLNAVDTVLAGLPGQFVRSDSVVEQNLRRLCEQGQGGRIVSVSGFAHVFVRYGHGEKNLYERVSDLMPVRIKLCDADKCVSKQ